MFNFTDLTASEALIYFGAKCTDAERDGIAQRYGVAIEPGESRIQAIAAVLSTQKAAKGEKV